MACSVKVGFLLSALLPQNALLLDENKHCISTEGLTHQIQQNMTWQREKEQFSSSKVSSITSSNSEQISFSLKNDRIKNETSHSCPGDLLSGLPGIFSDSWNS